MEKLLDQLIDRYRARVSNTGQKPEIIIIQPLALSLLQVELNEGESFKGIQAVGWIEQNLHVRIIRSRDVEPFEFY